MKLREMNVLPAISQEGWTLYNLVFCSQLAACFQ